MAPCVAADGVIRGAEVTWTLRAAGSAPTTQTAKVGWPLPIPVAPDTLARVTLREGDAPFEPSGRMGLERHVGYWTTPSLGEAPRRACDHALGDLGKVDALYLEPGAPRSLEGTIVQGHGWLAGAAAVVALVLAVGALIVAKRLLARAARSEVAEAELEIKFKDLVDEDRKAERS